MASVLGIYTTVQMIKTDWILVTGPSWFTGKGSCFKNELHTFQPSILTSTFIKK